MNRRDLSRLGLGTAWLIALVFAPFAAQAACLDPMIGSPCDFNAYSLAGATPSEVTVNATCRAVGTQSYVYVENALWSNGVTQNDVDALLNELEHHTPAFPERGIIDGLSVVFGAMPDRFDDDPKVYFVIHALADSATDPKGAYFRPVDVEYDAFDAPLPGSNQKEVVFVDADVLAYTSGYIHVARALAEMAAHSFDPQEEPWLADAGARALTHYLGYTGYQNLMAQYAASPVTPLIGTQLGSSWLLDHGATQLFGVFVMEKLTVDIFNILLTDSARQGIAQFEFALEFSGHTGERFEDYLHEWALWNFVRRGPYGYTSLNAPNFVRSSIAEHPADRTNPLHGFGMDCMEVNTAMLLSPDSLALDYSVESVDGLRVSLVRTSERDADFAQVDEQVLVGEGGTQHWELDGFGEGTNKVMVISSRVSLGNTWFYNLKTEILSEEADGDQPDGDAPDGDAEDEPTDGDSDGDEPDGDQTDGDVSDDDDDATDGDSRPSGFEDCLFIYTCGLDCLEDPCLKACLVQGTMEAQDTYNAYSSCLIGENPEGKNCMDRSLSTEERQACTWRNCNDLDILCNPNHAEPTQVVEDDGSGGGCGQTGISAWLLAALLATIGLAVSRRRVRSTC